MNLERAINDYIVWHKVSRHSEKTIKWYQWTLGTWHRWLVANGRSTAITGLTIADARDFLEAEGKRATLYCHHPFGVAHPGKLSDRTLHCYARGIRALFRWLVEEEYLTRNPMAKLKPPKLEQRMKEILTAEEIQRMLDACETTTFLGSRLYALVALMYDSGLRAGELVGLDLDDVQWAQYQVKVYGKGKKERLVPFGPAVHKALRRYLALRESFVGEQPQAIFITREGQRLTTNALSHMIKRLGQRVGIPRAHPHLFRHSAAVAAVMNGANQFELKRILGHTQLSTTDGYMDYAQQHLAERHRRFSPMAKMSERRLPSKLQKKRRRVK